MQLKSLYIVWPLITTLINAKAVLKSRSFPSHHFPSLGKRQSGYSPSSSICGTGDSCSESCGRGFETCQSNDVSLHCFNPIAGQICCPNGSGYACDEGYYCSQDQRGKTFCCPLGMDILTCAKIYAVASLELAHSTTTKLSTLIATPTITAFSTVLVTVDSTSSSTASPVTSYGTISSQVSRFPPGNATATPPPTPIETNHAVNLSPITDLFYFVLIFGLGMVVSSAV